MHQGLWMSWHTHVVTVATTSKVAVASFLCLGGGSGDGTNEAAPQEASDSLPEQLMKSLVVVKVHRGPSSSGAARLSSCFGYVRAFEAQRSRAFALIVHSRPDAAWFADIELETLLSTPHSVSVRARRMALQTTRQCFPQTAFSWWPVVDTFAKGCHDVNVSCLLVDDQVASVPRGLADDYFSALSSNGVETPSWLWNEVSGFGAPGTGCGSTSCNFFMHPFSWRSPSMVAAILGPRRDSFCHKSRKLAAACWPEARHTAKLLMHKVPLRVAPFGVYVREFSNASMRGLLVPKYTEPPSIRGRACMRWKP